MAIIQKRRQKDGSYSYRARVRVRGRPEQSKTFKKLVHAKMWAAQAENDIIEGIYFPKLKAERRTLAELIDRYLQEILPRKTKAMQAIQEQQLLWWKEQLGKRRLMDIRPALIIDLRAKLERGRVQGGKLRSPSTCNRYVAALRHAFTVAHRDWEWIPDNPISRIRNLREPRGRIRCLDRAERNRLLRECKRSRAEYLYLIVLIALSSGMRMNEILTLSWRQVDLKRGAVFLFKTKNGRPRRVPLQGEALEELKRHAKVRRLDTDLLFPGFKDPKKPVHMRDAWDEAVKRAKLEDFCFHDLRHTAASYYAMSGASARDLCDIFGWQTLEMAMRYAHLFDSHTAEIAQRMNDKFLSGDREEAETA